MIELDLTRVTTIESLLSVQDYPDDNKKSQWEKVVKSKEITMKKLVSQSDSSTVWEETFDIIFGIINPVYIYVTWYFLSYLMIVRFLTNGSFWFL